MQTLKQRPSEHETNTRQILRRFNLLNRDRLMRTQDSLSEHQQVFLDILPLLFHTNHAMLPGYVSKNTPFGICDYAPTERAQNAARRVARSFKANKRALRSFDIEGLYMMGSSGTIAYSQKSDFDIWLCHRKDLDPSALLELQQKAEAIEQWAEELRLEVHFFIFNAEEFRQGGNDGLSDEHSGSSQYYLLLDEFYRSGLVIAGLPPLWWAVEPDYEMQYEQRIEELSNKRFIKVSDFIDFGGLGQIPAEEFFGATLWQLYKSINSPYKSVLKLMLMEVYADEYPDMELLSTQYKRLVYNDVTSMEKLDPYLLMYQKVEEYLMAHNDSVRLDFLRKSFYLKVNEKLSQNRRPHWRRDLMGKMTRSWGWDGSQVERLDNKHDWRLQTVMDERRNLIRTLTQSYRKLSQFARQQAGISSISQQDLNILGRRLYSAFEKKAGKIELINRGITPNLYERLITIYQYKQAGGADSWLLYAGHLNIDEMSEATPMKRAGSSMDLLAWCHFNRIINEETRIQCHLRDSGLNVQEIRTLMSGLNELFPNGESAGSSTEELSHPSRIRKAALFINVGEHPRISQLREGEHLTSSRSNALSYGGLHENLVVSFDLLLETSWQEIYSYHFQGTQGLMECLGKYLCYSPLSENRRLAPISIRCYSSGYGAVIQGTIEQVFDEARQIFASADAGNTSYLLESANEYHILQVINDVPKHSHIRNQQQLTRHLGRNSQEFCPLVINANTLVSSPLQEIYKLNRPEHIQLFFRVKRNIAYIYILDEMGSLYYQTQPYHDQPSLLNHYALFLMSIMNRRQHTFHTADTVELEIPMEFYQCHRKQSGGFKVEKVDYSLMDIPSRYFDVQVIATQESGSHRNVTIYCDGHEFSTLEHGGEVFSAVARHVMTFRSSKSNYPIYITDIDLSESIQPMQNSVAFQTIQYLNYKKTIEHHLNKALQAL